MEVPVGCGAGSVEEVTNSFRVARERGKSDCCSDACLGFELQLDREKCLLG